MRPFTISSRGILALCLLALTAGSAGATGDAERGRTLFDAAGCLGCHTDKKNKGKPLAGGRELKTPFGVYYSPNITPDPEFGIGKWTDADFLRALKRGLSPKGEHYFPVFPYTSYTKMSDGDIIDLKAYIFTLPAVAQANREHEAGPVFGSRFMVGPWKAINFAEGDLRPFPEKGATWNRGAYLVEALGHCGECHTPRNRLGGFERRMHLGGTNDGPDGEAMPNITPDSATGIGKWTDGDLKALFSIGMLPDGDFVGGSMGEVVTNTTGRWSKGDTEAVIVYLRSLPALSHKIGRKKKEKTGGEWN